MELPNLLLASLAGYLVLSRFLIPRAEERWRADRTPAVVGKAVTVGVLKLLRTLAGAALLASVVVLIGVGLANAVGAALTRAEYVAALEVVAALRKGLGWVSKTFSLVCFALLCGALFYLTQRRTRRTMTEAFEEALRRDVDRLRSEAEARQWTPLEPTPEMLAVENDYAAVKAMAEAVRSDDPEQEPKLEAAQRMMAELEQIWVRLDWSRRLDPKWQVSEPSDDAVTGWRRAGNLLVSKGMFRTTGDLSTGMSRVALLLLFLSLFGFQAGPLHAAIDRHAVRLSEIAAKADKQEAIASAVQERSDEPVDEEVLDEVARRFEQAFANSAVVRGAVRAAAQAAARPVDLREMSVRRAILDAAAPLDAAPTTAQATNLPAGGTERLGQHPSMGQIEGLESIEKAALDEYARSASESPQPRNSIGRDMRRALNESGMTRTGVWGRLQADLRARRAEFKHLASLEDVGGDLVGEALGGVLDEFKPDPSTEVGKLADRLRGKATSEAIKRLYEIKRDAFLADIARGVDVRIAVDRVLRDHPRYVALTVENARTLQGAFEHVPRTDGIANRFSGRHPRLRWINSEPSDEVIRAAVEANSGEIRTVGLKAVADNLATYEDFFPGQHGAATNTPRSKLIRGYIDGVRAQAPSKVVNEVLDGMIAGNAMVDAATSYRRLSGFRRVGGVLLGQDPGVNPAVRFRDIHWQSVRDSVALWLVEGNGLRKTVGTFPAGTVHQALVYAADDRRVAVTMTTASRGLQILLHPALVDTQLGMDMINVDTYVDTHARFRPGPQAKTVVRATDDARVVHDLYRLAYMYRQDAVNPYTDEQEAVRRGLAAAEENTPLQAYLLTAVANWRSLSNPSRSPLRIKPEFYDSSLVRIIDACAGPHRTLDVFGSCIRARASSASESDTPPFVKSLREGVPRYQDWSGVRELAFVPDPGLAFLRPVRTGAPLRFMLQVAFASRPQFVQSGDTSSAFVADSTPWEYPIVASRVHNDVIRWTATDREGTRVLRSVQEFAILQRLFRTALKGHLGPSFRIDRLVPLARETRGSVQRVRTPRAGAPPQQRTGSIPH